jgi:hypothetical protein
VGKRPTHPQLALVLLRRGERRVGVEFPTAVREWYPAGGPALGLDIGCGETADEMVALRELGEPLHQCVSPTLPPL